MANYMTTEYKLCHGPFCVTVTHSMATDWCWVLTVVRADGKEMLVDSGCDTLVNARAAGIAALKSLGLKIDDDCEDGTCP